MKVNQPTEYLENPEYDLGWDWVVRNLPRVLGLLTSDGKAGDDGTVDYGYESQYRLDAIRQIGVRQDGSYYGTAVKGSVSSFVVFIIHLCWRRCQHTNSI